MEKNVMRINGLNSTTAVNKQTTTTTPRRRKTRTGSGSNPSYGVTTTTRGWVQIFVPKLVLEVLGAGGAIWGFSEALGLRNAQTQEQWRRLALVVAFVFFLRFGWQVRRHYFHLQSIQQQQQHTNDDDDYEYSLSLQNDDDDSSRSSSNNDVLKQEEMTTNRHSYKENQPLVTTTTSTSTSAEVLSMVTTVA